MKVLNMQIYIFIKIKVAKGESRTYVNESLLYVGNANMRIPTVKNL